MNYSINIAAHSDCLRSTSIDTKWRTVNISCQQHFLQKGSYTQLAAHPGCKFQKTHVHTQFHTALFVKQRKHTVYMSFRYCCIPGLTLMGSLQISSKFAPQCSNFYHSSCQQCSLSLKMNPCLLAFRVGNSSKRLMRF